MSESALLDYFYGPTARHKGEYFIVDPRTFEDYDPNQHASIPTLGKSSKCVYLVRIQHSSPGSLQFSYFRAFKLFGTQHEMNTEADNINNAQSLFAIAHFHLILLPSNQSCNFLARHFTSRYKEPLLLSMEYLNGFVCPFNLVASIRLSFSQPLSRLFAQKENMLYIEDIVRILYMSSMLSFADCIVSSLTYSNCPQPSPYT